MPGRQPALVVFHKIAKRRYDDISSVAVAFALDVERTAWWARPGSASAGSPLPPIRAAGHRGRADRSPGTEETVEAAAVVLSGEGTPIDDQRASAAFRSAMLGNAMREAVGRVMTVTTGPTTPLATRPPGAVVGVEMEHESAALHVTGHALYTDDLVGRTGRALRMRAPGAGAAHPRAGSPALRRRHPAYDVPGVVRVSPPPTCRPSTWSASCTTSRSSPTR